MAKETDRVYGKDQERLAAVMELYYRALIGQMTDSDFVKYVLPNLPESERDTISIEISE